MSGTLQSAAPVEGLQSPTQPPVPTPLPSPTTPTTAGVLERYGTLSTGSSIPGKGGAGVLPVTRPALGSMANWKPTPVPMPTYGSNVMSWAPPPPPVAQVENAWTNYYDNNAGGGT